MKKISLLVAMLVPMVPVAAWEMYKPIRVIAPRWVENISCAAANLCADDETKFPDASRLYGNALRYVANEVGPFRKHPRVIFCSTQACALAFGLKSTAATIGGWGIVIGPRGWSDYYVRHEMLHHRQVEELGLIAQGRDPKWFIEGMAYSLSEDPRHPLSEPWEGYRTAFEAWNRKVGKGRLWEEAGKL